MRLASRRAA